MIDSLKQNLLGLNVVLAMVALYTIDSNLVKLIAGCYLVIGLIISLIQLRRRIDLTRVQKRLS